jgi:hypothetical protein
MLRDKQPQLAGLGKGGLFLISGFCNVATWQLLATDLIHMYNQTTLRTGAWQTNFGGWTKTLDKFTLQTRSIN